MCNKILGRSIFIIFFLVMSFMSVVLFLGLALHHNFMQSDVLDYWNNSLSWQTPFHPFHVPGYPLMIAFARFVTLNIVPPEILMIGINLIFFLLSVIVLIRAFSKIGISRELANLGALFFGLWPLVGLTYTAIPLADIPAIFFFLLGFFCLISNSIPWAGLFLGICLITHKAMWLFVGLIAIVFLLRSRSFTVKREGIFVLLLGIPLGLLWILGANYHHSFTWLFSSNLQVEVSSRSHFPVFDGLLGTLLQGDIKSFVKGGILWGFFLFTILLLVLQWRIKPLNSSYGTALAVGVLILFVFLNQSEIWAAVRFSRLLVIPLMGIISSSQKLQNTFLSKPNWVLLLLLVALMSQFVYAWYIARVYFT
ncbi:hypothetical protein [Anaerolinea sp.]|uniref:hypothetical protein n=1 Tax=Anaerolinea sp. TaxID=1872519 RepID=UPI002ACE8ECC|nr:hypothetical protein [Anaerolinea sp.]